MIRLFPSILNQELSTAICRWSDAQPHRMKFQPTQPEPLELSMQNLPEELLGELTRAVTAFLQQSDVVTPVQPGRLSPPRLMQYRQGMSVQWHPEPGLFNGSGGPMRCDYLLRLALAPRGDYAGGGLQLLQDGQGRDYPMDAGDALIQDASGMSCIRPLHLGRRADILYRIESLVADQEQRQALGDLARAEELLGDSPARAPVSSARQQLIRLWKSDVQRSLKAP